MDEQTLRKIVREAVDVAIEPVKEDLSDVKETQRDHTRRLEALAGDVHDLKEQVKALDDKTGMYHSRNKREVDEIKKHLNLPLIPDRPEI